MTDSSSIPNAQESSYRAADRPRPALEVIPQLKAMGLTCVHTFGSGNCLFHALSDQLYGDQSHHAQLRAGTVEYMRQHPDDFKSFVTVNPGGGIRRNPKRKAVAAVSHHFDSRPPSAADIDTAFALSLDLMARGGTYGDNAEIIAFARQYGVEIRIWHSGSEAFYNVDGRASPVPLTEESRILYIVYHTYEHYSSVRNIDGPFEGLPCLRPKELSPDRELQLQRDLAAGANIQEWMIERALASLPNGTNRSMVIQTLRQFKGNINLAVDFLLPETSSSFSSTETMSDWSSSIERDLDSEEERRRMRHRRRRRQREQRQQVPQPQNAVYSTKLHTRKTNAIRQPHPLRNDTLPIRPKGGNYMISPDPRRLALALKRLDRQGRRRKAGNGTMTDKSSQDWNGSADIQSSNGSQDSVVGVCGMEIHSRRCDAFENPTGLDPDETEEEDWKEEGPAAFRANLAAASASAPASFPSKGPAFPESSRGIQGQGSGHTPCFRLSQPRPLGNNYEIMGIGRVGEASMTGAVDDGPARAHSVCGTRQDIGSCACPPPGTPYKATRIIPFASLHSPSAPISSSRLSSSPGPGDAQLILSNSKPQTSQSGPRPIHSPRKTLFRIPSNISENSLQQSHSFDQNILQGDRVPFTKTAPNLAKISARNQHMVKQHGPSSDQHLVDSSGYSSAPKAERSEGSISVIQI